MNKQKTNARVLGLTFPYFLCVIACLLNNFKVTVSRGDETHNISQRHGRATVCSKDYLMQWKSLTLFVHVARN